MKTSSEYRAIAWKELRKSFTDSVIIVLITMFIAAAIFAIIYGGYMFCTQTDHGAVLGVLCLVASFLLDGVLLYALYIWFLSVARHEPIYKISADGRGRVLLCGMAIFVPSLIQGPIQVVAQKNPMMALLSLVVIFFVLWYYYASSMITYLVHDHREASVWQSLKQSIRMMKGHKKQLIAVDIKIMVWPVLIFFLLMLGSALTVVSITGMKGLGEAASKTYIIGIGVLSVVFMIAFFFIVFPMMYLAHAHFYMDLLAEQSLKDVTLETQETEKVA
jgi:uncharacterized membrane protein